MSERSYHGATSRSLYAPSHRQDSTYHSLCYTSRGALAGTRNSSMGGPHEGSIRRPIAPSRSPSQQRMLTVYLSSVCRAPGPGSTSSGREDCGSGQSAFERRGRQGRCHRRRQHSAGTADSKHRTEPRVKCFI